MLFPNAPWCATNTDAADVMGKNDWGYCSKDCPQENDNFCYADTGKQLMQVKKCIFPFILGGKKFYRCTNYNGKLQCATKVNADGVATPQDMHKCTNTNECGVKNTVNGKPMTIGYVDVASYTNDGSGCMKIEFQYSTGFEDTTNSNWNVEASVSGGFSFFGAEFGASLTAGGGGGSSSSSSSEVSHTLSYVVRPFTRVTLKQLVAKAGNIQAHSFKIQLDEVSLKSHKEVKETLPGEKTANGTVITGLIPCPKFGDNDGDGGGKDGGDDGGDNGGDDGRDDNECSNEKFGETEEESDGKTSKRQKKYNENCSTYHKNTLKKKKEEKGSGEEDEDKSK